MESALLRMGLQGTPTPETPIVASIIASLARIVVTPSSSIGMGSLDRPPFKSSRLAFTGAGIRAGGR